MIPSASFRLSVRDRGRCVGRPHMKVLVVVLALLLTAAAITPAAAQLSNRPGILVVPPLVYDYPYPGTLIIYRGDKATMERVCPQVKKLPVPLGCNYRRSAENQCAIYIANDELLATTGYGWTYDIILRHEVGHCNGWPGDHKGMRPADAPRGKPPVSQALEQWEDPNLWSKKFWAEKRSLSILPPPEFDRPYTGKLTIVRV